jgi:glucose-1-phosphate cytidylyltransferase
MKIVILAGGLGTRLHEYTKTIPKPMVQIGGYPILIHIINIYLRQGFNDFYIATGYKKEIIKKYFNNYKKNGIPFECKIFKKKCKITLVDTGNKTLTGGRLKRIKKFLPDGENFMFTYGDGISDINIKKLLKFHLKRKKLITVTAVRPPARFGEIVLRKKAVIGFKEKPQVTEGWINGGFFIAKKEFLDLIKSDKTILEKDPLEHVVKNKNLSAYTHSGFWKCMDTKRDKDELEKIYKKNKFNWKI